MIQRHTNLILLLTALIWGTAFVSQKTAMQSFEPLTFTGLRFLLGALVILPMAMWDYSKRSLSGFKVKAELLLIGLSMFAGAALQQVALVTTSVTNAGFLTGLYVVLVPLMGWGIFRHKPHVIVWPCSFLSLLGIWLISGGEGLSALTTGDIQLLIGAFFWALHILLITGALDKGHSAFVIAFVQFLCTGVLAIIAGMLNGETGASLLDVASVAPELIHTGVFATGVAFTLQVVGQQKTPAAQAAILLSTESLFAALAAVVLLGERHSFIVWTGCGLLFFAALFVNYIPALSTEKAKKTL